MFEAVSGIERLCGELATEKLTDSNLDHLKGLHERMTNHFNNGQRHDYFRLNQETHNLIVQLSGNSVLREIHANIMIKVRRARYLAILSVERWEESVKRARWNIRSHGGQGCRSGRKTHPGPCL